MNDPVETFPCKLLFGHMLSFLLSLFLGIELLGGCMGALDFSHSNFSTQLSNISINVMITSGDIYNRPSTMFQINIMKLMSSLSSLQRRKPHITVTCPESSWQEMKSVCR